MNAQIKTIGRQAGFSFIGDAVYGDRWYSSKCGMDAPEFEKFAELIIRECASIVENAVDHREPASTYVNKIKQHFGVSDEPLDN